MTRFRAGSVFEVLAMIAAALAFGGAAGAQEASPTPAAIDPAKFTSTVDNPYFPLVPGTVMIYEGHSEDAETRNEITVLTETRTVMGVECLVVRDVAYEDGELIEDTLDWFAQDSEGSVWYFGEESKDIEDGEVVDTHGSWEAGVDGALPGIIMPAEPVVGEPYFQEWAPGVAEDMGQIIRAGETVTVPAGTFADVLVTKDWNPLEPDSAVEEKFYAPGIGLIKEVAIENEDEELELVEIRLPESTPAA
jgi:hypothetical protein